MKRILIIEDEVSLAKIMAYDLKKEGYEVEVATTGDLGLKKAKESHFDVIIVDWMLPKMEGPDIIKALRTANIQSVIVMASAKSDELDVVSGLEAGADDYLKKPFSSRELSARLLAHLRRVKVDNQISQLADISVDYKRHEVMIGDEVIDLTKKEFELLVYFIKNVNVALNRDQILQAIWGYSYDGDTRIVDVHVFKLRDKLAKSELTLSTIRGLGYRLE